MERAVNGSDGKEPGKLWRSLARVALFAVAWLLQPAAHAADLLDPEEAFRVSATVADDGRTVVARFHIADGYYLYRERFGFAASDGVRLGLPLYPVATNKFDETLAREVPVYRGDVVVSVPIESGTDAFVFTARMQGCADQGVCYPPETRRTKLSLVDAAGVAGPRAEDVTSIASPAASPADAGRIDSALRSRSLLAVLPIFFVLGLLLSFTPCVLPMLPILSSIIVGQTAARHSDDTREPGKARGFTLALAYALGVAIVYTALGIAAGLAGEGFAGALQQPWVLFLFAALLVALALSLFGLYELQLPAALQTRLAETSGRISGGRFASVFAIGATSALIVGPCVAAPLAGVLLYISQTHDVVIGGVALFAIACGMSVPLLLVGAGAASLLPRAGRWMQSVERLFGVLLIAVALWTISPVIPVSLQMLGWAALAIVGASFLRVFDTPANGASGWLRLWQGVGLMLLVLGAAELVGAARGSRDVLQPLGAFAFRDDATEHASKWTRIESVEQLDVALASARGNPVVLDFYADWCVSCKEMDRFTFADPRVMAALGGFQLLRADVTANSDRDRALLKRFHLFGPPGTIFFDGQGREVEGARVIGFESGNRFLASVARAADPEAIGRASNR